MAGALTTIRKSAAILLAGLFLSTAAALADEPAKQAFGHVERPSATAAQSIGFYSKGCLAGAQPLPIDGPNWQVMRLSRNRNWGHPAMIQFLEQLSRDAAKDGWPGLLIGDISQPRGGPMLNGHASHQVGLDADIWLTPMPDHRLTREERETMQGISMLKPNSLYADPKKWTPARTALIKNAATNPQVERIFVHPGIKKQLCETVKGDRAWLGKVRPYYGHFWHFHIRIKCQPGSANCKPQAAVAPGDGCDKSLAWWFTSEPWAPAKPPKKTTTPPKKPREVMVSDLPQACAAVLAAPDRQP
ncbi:penicillin-insensitive murein endopeptidase [Bartonella sp. LJL80]